MMIKNLDIHSFGKLKNKKIEFTPGFNVIYGQNESGKSTVSAFIEAMLYSYPARDAQRKKYIPWDSQFSQGSLLINHNGEDIAIYRRLTASSTKDITEISPRVNLYDFIPKDRETYRKSVYCREGKASDFGHTAEIDMRIANIISTGNENVNGEKAVLRLEDFRRTLKPKKGSGGKLKEIEDKITLLENMLEDARIKEFSSIENKKHLENLENELLYLTKKRQALIDNTDDSAFSDYKQLDREIRAQEEYIASFPDKMHEVFPKFRFSPLLFVCYSICVLLFLIIGFLTESIFLLISLFPLLSCLCHYLLAKKLHSKEEKAFFAQFGCFSREEYEKMLSEKKEAQAYYNSLVKTRQASFDKEFSQKLNAKEEINLISNRMLEITNRIMELKSSFPSQSTPSSAEIEGSLKELKEQRGEMIRTIEALDKAIEAINYAKEKLSKTLTPSVAETAMRYIDSIAPKEGRNITLSKDFSLFLTDPMPQAIDTCSMGLKEEIYLCFRIALSEYLYGKDFPLIFDDPFAGSDDYREKALIDLFTSLSCERQIIIFTNRINPYYNQIPCNFIDITPTFVV